MRTRREIVLNSTIKDGRVLVSKSYLEGNDIVESPPMGTEDLDNNFWWAEPLNRVKIVIEEGLPSGHSPKR
jgi:hypothetical protein